MNFWVNYPLKSIKGICNCFFDVNTPESHDLYSSRDWLSAVSIDGSLHVMHVCAITQTTVTEIKGNG